MPLRVYIDTSVLGGCFDKEFAAESNNFIDGVTSGAIIALVSDILVLEISEAPERVQEILRKLLSHGCERLDLTEETERLRDAYIQAGIIVPKYADDALHVAHATLAGADVIVSWNFRHLVNPIRMRAFNSINTSLGYGQIIILTPFDIIKSLEEDNENEKEV